MQIISNLLIKMVVPIFILYLAFTYLGTIGGLVAVAIYFGVFNLSMIIQNIAGRKYRAGDYNGALKLLEKAVRISPRNYKTRGTFAYLLLKTGNTNDAAEQIDKAISDCAKGTEKNTLDVTKSLIVWKQGDTDKAISILEDLIKNFQNTNVYGTLGFLYIEKGDLDRALSFNLEAYEYNGTNPIILDNLGSTRILRHEYDEALPIYEQLMKAKPGFPVAFFNYACVLEHFGKLDEAAYMCRYALTLKFWNISTITREEVEEKLNALEAAIKEQEDKEQENKVQEEKEQEDTRKSVEDDPETLNSDKAADISIGTTE